MGRTYFDGRRASRILGPFALLVTFFLTAVPSAEASPPFNTSAPTVAGSAALGQTLTAGAGSWNGTPAPTLSYQWERCEAITPISSTFASIPGTFPETLVMDPTGNVFTANRDTDNVSKITPAGNPVGPTGSTVSSPFTWALAGDEPLGSAIDSAGNVYVANRLSNTVTKVDTQGVVTNLDTGPAPANVAVDSQGTVYTADLGAGTISKIVPPATSPSTTFLGFGTVFFGMAFDANDNLYVADSSNDQVVKITPGGSKSVFGATGDNPFFIALDPAGNVYTVNASGAPGTPNTVTKLLPNGSPAGSPWPVEAGASSADSEGLTIDSEGNLYVTNGDEVASTGSVTKITPGGVASTLGSTGGWPLGIEADPAGNVYVANRTGATVTKITQTSCIDISGASSPIYQLQSGDYQKRIRVEVSASNGVAPSSRAFSTMTGQVTGQTSSGGGVSPPAPNTPPQPKVTLCHSGNGKNFTTITIAPEAAIDGHARNHDDDIIPPFDYVKNGKTLRFAGQNWNAEGRAILDNGCRSPSSNPANSIFNPPEVNKVTLCHSGNGKNFVEITIAPQGVLNGHSRNHSHDIIPPFSFGGTSFPGQNWDATGQGIFNNGCERPQPVTDPVEEPAQKVSICHSAAGKKFVSIEVAVAAALNGHSSQHEEDIIPPFKYRDKGEEKTFPGQNWGSEGQAIFNNGCVPPAPPPNQPDPQPVVPTVTCVDVASDGSYTAYFGYQSSGLVAQTVAAGVDNSVTLSAAGSGASSSAPPTVFQPGVVGSAVTVSGIASGGSAIWSITVGGKTSTAIATSESTACEPEPEPVDFGLFAVCTERGTGGTYSVTFGYQNDNTLPVNVPIGRNNRVLVDGEGGPDRGQPATLAAGRNGNAFTISGLKTSKSVAWEVTVGGLQRVATADSSTPACASPPPTPEPEPEPEPRALEPIGPSVRCVALNSDGSYDVVFGYSNPNLVTIEVPAGAANGLRVSPDGPGPETRGQPTAFEPGSVGTAFSVTRIPAGQEITWTVASYGTRSATAGIGFPTRCEGDTPEKTPEPPPINPEPARQAIGIYLKCVDAGKSSYSATFGYVNPGSVALTIPTGEDNRLVGSSKSDRGQPSVFAPGDAPEAFRLEGIDIDGRPTWRVTNPNGSVVTAVADPAAPNCTTGNPERGPETDVNPDVPPKGPIQTEIDNPGTEPDWKPTVTFEVPNKAKVTDVNSKGVKCKRKGRKVTCKASKLLPGQKAKVTIKTRCRRPGSGLLGVASVVSNVALKPGEVSSGSGTVRTRGCKRPKPKPPTG